MKIGLEKTPLIILIVGCCQYVCYAFNARSDLRRPPFDSVTLGQGPAWSLGAAASSYNDDVGRANYIRESKKYDALVDAIFDVGVGPNSTPLTVVNLKGQARLPVATNSTTRMPQTGKKIVLVLGTGTRVIDESEKAVPSLLLPLASPSQLKLVSFAGARRPLSKSVLLGLNTLLVNRDGALFDNLPWSSWSVDPQKRNRDAAGNVIDSRFHLGKRDAYNRFMGKDWQGRSLAIGNLALRLKYMLEHKDQDDKVDINSSDESSKVLAVRLLQLQIREQEMELADADSELAIVRNDPGSRGAKLALLEGERETIVQDIQEARDAIEKLEREQETVESMAVNILEKIADWTTKGGENAAPYRGAMGYAPILDSKEDIEDSLLPYTSPYDLLKEILADQLNARVIGCVLENTSLLRGNIALGGAIVLQRKLPTKSISIAGEKAEYEDFEEDFGNEGILAGETIIVECDSDEAVGIALACDVPLKVESNILERNLVNMSPGKVDAATENIIEVLSLWKTTDPDMSLQVEGERTISENTSPISIPRTTSSLFDELFEEKERENSSLFPTDNPIRSLEELNKLSNEDKAKTLLEMSNFSGKLPRPRVVRSSASTSNPLDKLLLPLIDESVRRQYYIREAEKRGDTQSAQELREEASRRQYAKEKADKARQGGSDDEAAEWETEAEFLETLRADVTQDEGAYSRFLDRDYWYEKDRQATAKRVDRSKFGNLLDGIE